VGKAAQAIQPPMKYLINIKTMKRTVRMAQIVVLAAAENGE
jgi:hypothetical protein